ncbi:baculoviral IAP repeat-containing protein 7 isoform X2 [Anthonomus grandis grandis]|nr:baculoviral IAP repeat-containing protein 7 isoform X2 [Anthonomus grandis grandis]XP_050306388.1 baculoviral IAP repeat-containing protein 7 isoform X2 [Anthonomus grandis grandis]XP_050306389.1 baculoviral IAP repeat-containing protein 7 isoform X2 [Anthonomus grandis grandis]
MSGQVLHSLQKIFNSSTVGSSKQHYLTETDNGNKTTRAFTAIDLESLNLKNYEDRLKSYANWPNKDVSKEVLAKAGFFYKNCNDLVQCPFCFIEGYQWVAGDNPMQDHRTWSPRCPFVMTSVEPDSPSRRNTDTCGLYGVEVFPNSVPEDEIQLERLGISKSKSPAHPDKAILESRLETFSDWPKSLKQTPKDLADAGFFYIGVGDQTICFHCGGGLKDWEANDSPWEEHALWFPKCSYLFLKKGPQYISAVKEKRDPKARSANLTPETKETLPEPLTLKETESGEEEESKSEKTLCKICFKNDVGIVFLPCGHIVACVDCSAALKTCAICRKPLEGMVRAFLS